MKRTIPAVLILAVTAGLLLSLSACGAKPPSEEALSPLVADAVLSDNSNAYSDGECPAEGHRILGSRASGHRLTVYALTMYGNYGFRNDMFIKVSGSGVIPAVLTFEKNGGEYTLLEIEYPRDGAGYTKSIKKMFPARYRSAALHADNAYDGLKAQEQRYAEAYLNSIGREAEIGEYGDLNAKLLTGAGVSVDVSNRLCRDKDLGAYPLFLGTAEYLEDQKRYVRSVAYDEQQDQIIYMTYEKESGMVIERIVFDATTGELTEKLQNQKSGYSGASCGKENSGASDDKVVSAIEVCTAYISANEPENIISAITNFDLPSVAVLEELPAPGTYMRIAADAGTGPYYKVTFSTAADAVLGPIEFLVNQESDIVGLFCRE